MNTITNLTLFDIILGFLFFMIIYTLGIRYSRNKIKTSPEYKYFIFALFAKLLGSIAFALCSIYYYKLGDTFVYFNAAEELKFLCFMDLEKAANFYFSFNISDSFVQTYLPLHAKSIFWSEDVYNMVKITSIINLFSFGSFLISSMLFGLISFFGLWLAFSNFSRIYPAAAKYMFIPFFLIPTSLIWGGGVLKDTLVLGAIGGMLYSFSNLSVLKRKETVSLVIAVFGILVLFLLKPFILYALIPALFVWGLLHIKRKELNNQNKGVFKAFAVVLITLLVCLSLQNISGNKAKYSVNNLGETLDKFHSWHNYLSINQHQSGYALGGVEISFLGLLRKAPEAFVVTYFRPYLWEVKNIPTILGACESLILLLYFIFLLVKFRINFFVTIIKNKQVLFLLLFATIFGVAVGLSSYNFGALSRYKVPATLFFILSLLIIHQENKEESNQD